MIFKDSQSINDTDELPAHRGPDICLNCARHYNTHNGWLCMMANGPTQWAIGLNTAKHNWSQCHYLTRSMMNSLGARSVDEYDEYIRILLRSVDEYDEYKRILLNNKKQNSKPKDNNIPQWLLSREISTKPGECPCGINRQQCNYHE